MIMKKELEICRMIIPTDFPFHRILRLQAPRGQRFYVNRSDGLACVSYACFRYRIQVSMRAAAVTVISEVLQDHSCSQFKDIK